MRVCGKCETDINDRNYRARWCVPCVKERRREYGSRWREANPEYQSEYHEANQRKVKKRQRKWREANREKLKGRREANREANRKYARMYREANPEKLRDARRRYYEAKREKVTEASSKWQKANPEKKGEINRRRRARKLGQLGTVTPGIKRELWERQKRRCAGPGCGKRIEFADARLDHYIAVAKGGLYDDANFQVLCAPCNGSKGAKDPIEWAQSRGSLL